MNRIRGGATALGLACFLAAGAAHAQDITGGVVGRVTDQDTGAPLGGVTVISQGPQGEDATLTDEKGDYTFLSLPLGTYTLRFYVANASAQVEQPGVLVSAAKVVRVNVKIASAVQAAAQQTYVITGKAPTIDVGSARVGADFGENFTKNVPLGRNYGDVIERAPGTFFDPSGNVSIAGATGLENIYIVNGLNVTGVEYGNLENGVASLGGGTNLPLEFLNQVDVSSGGYQAEYGGAMGGVINSVLKSGSNQFHGSAFSYWSPYWMAGDPNAITTVNKSLGYVRKPDYDTSIGVEVGGPIIKDKLFFWAGFAPRFQNTHVFRLTYALSPDLDANGNMMATELRDWRARINESRSTYNYAATVDWIPRPEHRLTVALLGTPNFNDQMRSFSGVEFISNPSWAAERLNKTNTDTTAHWTSKLYDHRWQIDAFAGLHSETFNNLSPTPALNNLNQLEYWGANLYDLEGAPGCKPDASGFQPCPVDNYHTGGYGLMKKYTAFRWNGEVKSTHLFEAGGHHELKYGWRVEFATFDQDRSYSGPLGGRALSALYPQGGNFATTSFFTLQPGTFPSDFGDNPNAMPLPRPVTDLLHAPEYQDTLHAYVKSLANAFFLQDSFSPKGLRNLTINAGVRLELQKMYDHRGGAFLDTNNLAPRIGAIYDPFGDGRSKISFAYGRYFEAIPLNLAARYFGGEGIFVRGNVPFSNCANQSPYGWTGAGEWRDCNIPAQGEPDPAKRDPQYANNVFNNGSNYPVQANLQGQYHNEVVATLAREIIEDLTLRLDYQHRWMGAVIEDGTNDGSFIFVLANPGDVPSSALNQAQTELNNAQAAADADPTNARAASLVGAAQAKLNGLEALASAPKPQRTYDALTLSLSKRFSRNWLARASYTYSRLIGNYEGLFQAAQFYYAPNGSNAYDTPDLYLNSRGSLPNDRPNNLKVDGYYSRDVGKGRITFGLSFSARSGMPRNYMASLLPSPPQEIVFLLPRGSAGRTPTVTQADIRLAYGRELSPKVNLEAFIDLFNIFNQQASILVDDNYTYDWTAPIENGTTADLKFAKNAFGQPVNKNPNYGQTIAFQAPFHARLGLKLTF